MNSKEEVIRKVLEGAISLDQLKGRKNLFDTEAELTDLDQILSTTQQWDTPDNQPLNTSWNQILNKTEQKEMGHKEAKQRRLVWLPLVAAVSLVLIAGYFIFSSNSSVLIESGVGEIRELSLPDGTGVVLNALSSISYKDNWEDGRKVILSGKARFDVTKGATFEVITENYVTTVLGTSFDVSYEDEIIEVSCYTGSVEVSNETQSYTLTKGERALVENGQLVEIEFDIDASQKWVTGEFYFNNIQFEKVVDELSKQFDLEIVGLPADNRLYKGYFYKDSLTEALDLVFKPMGYDYRLEGRRVVIK